MLHEKHNETFHWKNRLDELEHLPMEEDADKTGLWERLHARLTRKQKKNKVVWYWTAAACVLVAVGISQLFTGEKTGIPVTEENIFPSQQSSPKNLTADNEPLKGDTESITVLKEETKKTSSVFNDKKNKIPRVAIVSEQIDVSIRSDLADSTEVTVGSTFRSPDTVISNVIAATPIRKKLRVIHINELENETEQENRSLETAFPSAKREKSSYQGISAFSLSKNASDNIVKIKLSPSN